MLPNILASLLLEIAEMLGDIPVNDLPAVVQVPRTQLRALCNQCDAAYVRPVIYLADDIDPGTDHGVYLIQHELIHHYQEMRGRYGLTPSPARWREREREAYLLMEGQDDRD